MAMSPSDRDSRRSRSTLLVVVGGEGVGFERDLRELLGAAAGSADVGFVVVHLGAEALQPAGMLPDGHLRVVHVSGAVAPEPGTVQVVAAGMVSPAEGVRGGPGAGEDPGDHPLDRLLEVLARQRKGDVVAVILSGHGVDGAEGVRAVKRFGGRAFVQAPEEAACDEMPRAALATGLADAAVPVGAIVASLRARIRRCAARAPTEAAAPGDEPTALPVEARGDDGSEALRDELRHRDTQTQKLEGALRAAAVRFRSTIADIERMNESPYVSGGEPISMSEALRPASEEGATVDADRASEQDALDRLDTEVVGQLDSTLMPTLFLDRALRITRFTPAATTVFGLIPGDLGRSIADIAPRFHGANLVAEAQEVLRTDKERAAPVRHEDGRTHMLLRALPYRGPDGTVDGVVVTFLDVTATVEGERHWALLAAIVEGSQDAILSKELDGTIRSWNGAAERLYGFAAEEAVGQNIAIIVPDDQRDELDRLLASLREGERIPAYETVRRRRDGSLVEVSLTISPIRDRKGRVVGGSTVAHDITRQRRAEAHDRLLASCGEALAQPLDEGDALERFARALVPDLADGCVINLLGEQGDLSLTVAWDGNPAAARAVRDLRAMHPIGLDADHGPGHVVRTGKTEVVARLADAPCLEAVSDDALCETVRRIGAVSRICAPLVVRDQVVGALTVVMASSGRAFAQSDARLVEELACRAAAAVENARLLRAARAASQTRDRFLAVLSHELRTPLTPALSAVSVLRESTDQLETQRLLDIVQRNIVLEARLIDDLLDLTRIGRGKIDLRVEDVDMHRIIGDLVQDLRPVASERGLSIEARLAAEHHHVRGDVARLTQVLWNLLGNAMKYTEPGGRIAVSSRDEEGRLAVAVEDTGIGFDAEEAGTLFAAFEQADPGRPGLGLGLTIVKALVELHEGSLEATSEGKGRGATFTVRLPREPATRADTVAAPESSASESGPKAHILLVDNHPDTVELTSLLLRRAGHEVTTAGSVAEAQAVAEGASFDLLISDISLPDGNGRQLLGRLRERGGPGLGIAMSGFGSDEDIQASLDAGFDVHLVKPFDSRSLLATIERLLAGAKR